VQSSQTPPKPIHPFPARMAASIPWEELQGPRPLRVLDPMAGSGTTLVVARALGHEPIGFDTDPLAVLLARTWCADIPHLATKKRASEVYGAAGLDALGMPLRQAYPVGADGETKEFVRYWFDNINRKQLTALSTRIAAVKNKAMRSVLWCAFSRLIIAKQAGASRALDLSHSRPHRVDSKPTMRPLAFFLSAVDTVLRAAPFGPQSTAPAATVGLADARRLPLPDESVDVVITSPPYLNAIDYLRGHKFSLVWMGYNVGELRTVRAENIGTEAARAANPRHEVPARALRAMGGVMKLPHRHQAMFARYALDMDAALREIRRVLVRGGRALLVVGDCSIRGVFIRNSRALAELAERHGLRVTSVSRRRLPPNRRYLPPPSADSSGDQLGHRLRTEVLLRLTKAA